MAICVRFSHLFYTYFLHPTSEMIRLIDSYINTSEFRYVPQNCCVKYYRHWLFISGDLFDFYPKK